MSSSYLTLAQAAGLLESFAQGSLTARIADLEKQLTHTKPGPYQFQISNAQGVDTSLFVAASVLKGIVG